MLTRRLALWLFGGFSLKVGKSDDNSAYMSKNGFFNGRYWILMKSDERVDFINGATQRIAWSVVLQSYVVELATTKQYAGIVKAILPKLGPEDVVKVITSFYNDPTNLNIPIMAMFGIVSQKLNGSQPEEIEKALAGLRASFKE
jgi:hypothetical protein